MKAVINYWLLVVGILIMGCNKDNPVSSNTPPSVNGVLVYDRGKVDSVYYNYGIVDSIARAFDFSDCDSVIYTYTAKTSYIGGIYSVPSIQVSSGSYQSPHLNDNIKPHSGWYNDGVFHDYREARKSSKGTYSYLFYGFCVTPAGDYLVVKNLKIWKK